MSCDDYQVCLFFLSSSILSRLLAPDWLIQVELLTNQTAVCGVTDGDSKRLWMVDESESERPSMPYGVFGGVNSAYLYFTYLFIYLSLTTPISLYMSAA